MFFEWKVQMKPSAILGISLTMFALLLAACARATTTPSPTAAPMAGMGQTTSGDLAPLVTGFYDGGEVLFIHTEASDPDVADMLTDMMGPQVVLVPELAQAPEPLLANVYVFTNGVQGMGPFGFQPDVFDSVPGEEGYRPLRTVSLVTWQEGATPRELRSVEEIQAAEAAGEVAISLPDIVVNMPILSWPGGHR
jgi:hypothetical protein